MSLSSDDNDNSSAWGTIFSRGGEHSLGGMEQGKSTCWTADDEAEYLGRVKEKATVMAKNLLDDAKAEAARIQESAHQDGYNQGLADAQAELDAFRSAMADSVATVLSAIEGQCSHIFAQWRDDLVAITRLAVEKGTGIYISEDRAQMLESLLVEAVDVLEKRRELIIRVNPEDEPVVADIVDVTRGKYPDVKAWRVRADASISSGGMVVESESSLAEGRVEARLAAVEEVLQRLSLPGLP